MSTPDGTAGRRDMEDSPAGEEGRCLLDESGNANITLSQETSLTASSFFDSPGDPSVSPYSDTSPQSHARARQLRDVVGQEWSPLLARTLPQSSVIKPELLPANQAASLKGRKSGSGKLDEDDDGAALRKSGISGLFRYASCGDRIILAVGLLFAFVHGASFPVLALVFGQMTNTFIIQTSAMSMHKKANESSFNDYGEDDMYTTSPTLVEANTTSVPDMTELWRSGALSPSEFTAYMSQFSLYYFFIGVGVLTAGFIQTFCWEMACERQVHRLRKIFFAQVLRQDISWYDQNQGGDITTKLSDDLERVREGIGSKFSMVVQYIATFISGLAVGLVANWRLTVVILAVGPLLIGTSGFLARVAASSSAREQLKYSIAGGIAEEVLTCIRTVAAFGGQEREVQRYGVALEKGRWMAMKKYYALSVGLGVVFFVTYASYGLAFWYGSELIGAGLVTPGSVFTVFFSVMAGAFSLGSALPFVNAVSTAVGAASNIFNIIDRIPDIDPYDTKGLKPEKVKGLIEFCNVGFSYPARKTVTILDQFNISIKPGNTVALVGPSGAGKSTVVGLLLRFYDTTSGKILLDGTDIKDLNLSWLRSQIGLVSQEPVLFGTSIYENICYGRDDVTRAEVVQAAIISNAHSFITELPDGYDTTVGDRGAQLSGGQKQRIAIARALVRDPKILLLDEATSALDAQSEGVVQAALDSAMQGRTTIIIAHRLSTVRNADVIYAMKDGAIEEFGTHKELMQKEGLFHHLVMAQMGENEEQSRKDYSSGTDGQSMGMESIEANSNSTGGRSLQVRKRRSLSLSIASLQDPELDRLAKETDEVDSPEVSVARLFRLNKREWGWLLLGFLSCACTGSIMPIFAFFYGEVFATFTLKGEELRRAAVFWTYMFLVLAVVSGFSFWLQLVSMTTAAEKLVMRMRLLAFRNICAQAVGWFDLESSSPGRLISRLARDAPLVKAAAGLRAGQVISALVTLAAALLIAFLFGWKLALLLVIAVPFIAGASYQQMMILRRNQRRDAELMNDAMRVASESVMNIRTVQALGKERLFFEIYMGYLAAPFLEAKKQAIIYSAVFALSQAVIYMMYAGAFRFGAYLIEIGDMAPTDVYRVFFALAFCAASVGQTSAYVQDYTKAKLASALMFQLMDRKPDIDCSSITGIRPVIIGKVTLKDVYFRYPSRPDVQVLRGLSLTVQPGQTVALVGSSGCGKSTVVSLLERFYDPTMGAVMVDDVDTRTMNLPHLRAHIGLVTQEPVLFDCSIRENIAYGKAFANTGGNCDGDVDVNEVPMDEIITAAKIANIHNFIISLPQGYDTSVGDRGTQMSGGQKQRIAIARALIRDPRILLLDEATSALDTESEKIVQEALDRARAGRTCIVIAHRLSTVHNADSIAVIHRGRIVEQGSHEELKERRGRYFQLIKRQRL